MDWSFVAAPVASIAQGIMGQNSARDAMESQYKNQSSLMRLQHDLNVDDYSHRYRWAVHDMREAGLNPILAATNGIGGSVNGTGLGSLSAVAAPVPDLAGAVNSAVSNKNQREIAKMQNDLGKDELELRRLDVNSAIEQRKNDITLSNGRFQLDKMVQEAAVKRADALNDATIQNMKDRLQADIEHYERMDLNGSALAAAAMQSANAAGLQAEVARELGISKSAVMQAEQAYIGLQSENAEENLKWQRWLNDHPATRGAVGFLGALFDTVATAKGVKNLGNSVSDLVD